MWREGLLDSTRWHAKLALPHNLPPGAEHRSFTMICTATLRQVGLVDWTLLREDPMEARVGRTQE